MQGRFQQVRAIFSVNRVECFPGLSQRRGETPCPAMTEKTKILGGLQVDPCLEVGQAERNRLAPIAIRGVPEQAHSGVGNPDHRLHEFILAPLHESRRRPGNSALFKGPD